MSSGAISGPANSFNPVPNFHPSFTVVRGYEKVLALHSSLCDLAERCGQSGVMDYLPFFLSASRLWGRVPQLLLLPGSAGELEAAVLLYEYGVGPISSGIFIPADLFGKRTVLAPERIRSAVVWRAAESLLDRGAHLVYLSLENGDFSSWQKLSTRTCATRRHIARRTLLIRSTFEDTVAGMGPHTRRNLRHFRRLTEFKLGAKFVPESSLSEANFLAFNRDSLYPVFPWIARGRFHKVHGLAEGFLAGLRAGDGSWLSLIGGRRQHRITYIDWQVNIKAHPALSIGTAMRAYLIEDEVARGTQHLTFEDGTPHPMSRAFVPEYMCDLLLARRTLSPNLLRKLAARIPIKHNMLAGNILDKDLVWHGSESNGQPSPKTIGQVNVRPRLEH
jgi:hypothetical protein